MGKRTLDDKKNLAFELFMNTDKSQKDIAEIVGVAEKTISKWKQQGKWEELKGAETVTAQKIVANLYQKAYELSEADVLDADKIIKIANSIEKLSDKRVTVSNTINVFKEFTGWLMKENTKLAKAINTEMKKYVNEKVNG